MSSPFESSPILRGLNPQQREAVLACEGPVLILAGAGSGKTRVITHRVAHLVHDRGVAPGAILAVTFTNKAANEMRTRVAALAGEDVRCWISTFHAFCVRVLRRDGTRVGLPRGFSILDEGERLSVVRESLRSVGIAESEHPARRVLGWISRWKSRGDDMGQEASRVVEAVADEYAQRLERLRAVDFDDLLLRTRQLLGDEPGVRDRYRAELRYLLVDEYQDTNRPQYEIVRLLAGENGNLTAVGDEDQSIYSWRGADIRNILAFEKDFPGARILRLEHNYRSNPVILEAAAAVVANNTERKGKTLRSTRERGEPVRVHNAETESDEASWVAQQLRGRERLGDVAVLMRLNAQSRVLEEALRRFGIPYTVIGGVSFFERREVKDVLAYARLVARVDDDAALRRVINVPPRGIGPRTLAAIEAQEGASLWEKLDAGLDRAAIPARAEVLLRPLVRLVEDVREAALSVSGLLAAVVEGSGYGAYVASLPQGQERAANLGELVSAAKDFESRSEGGGLTEFLDEVTLASSVDESGPGDAVKLMTLHAAKGLEFGTVFVVGLEDGLLPFSRARDSRPQIEEERRLLYVGMTRAKDRLFLSWAQTRQMYGRRERTTPSRFLDELPAGLAQQTRPGTRAWPTHVPRTTAVRALPAPSAEETLRRGAPVRHATFGEGTVVRVDGSGPEAKLTVAFSSHGVKRLVARYAALEPL